jgi:uncharacterized membrane protein YedE/YeeE
MLVNPTDWMLGLLGGLMIGGAAALLLLGAGRIMGVSGIVGALLRGDPPLAPRAAFVAGLVAAPLAMAAAAGAPQIGTPASPLLLAVGGLLVGWGVRRGAGCTSGHGVCGMARLSPRSLAATAAFMAVAVAMATALHVATGG